MINLDGQPIIPILPGRGPRYILQGDYSVGLANVHFKLREFSWTVETQSTNMSSYNNQGVVSVQNVWTYRYVFLQAVYKQVNYVPDHTNITGSSPGFGSTPTNGQSRVFPDPAEISVLDLPAVFSDSDFEGGAKVWTVAQYRVARDAQSAIFTASGILTAKTKWKPIEGLQRTLPLPDVSTLPVRGS
jgi:hypothetical protein